MLTAYSRVSLHNEAPRVWFESQRLTTLGFAPRTRYDVAQLPTGIVLTPAPAGSRKVSSRPDCGSRRPILDLNSRGILGALADVPEVKLCGSYGRLELKATVRATQILRGRAPHAVYRFVDVCCGGGTASRAFNNPRFRCVAGIEITPGYADEFVAQNPAAELFLGDFRSMHADELPDFDGLFMGIPCDEHSKQGRSKKGLAGRPELGRLGDLYLSTVALMSARMPAFAVFENVPAFGPSVAGLSLVAHLRRIGYSVVTADLNPLADFAEPSTRDRWYCVATLQPGFAFENPRTPFTGTLGDFLDAPDADLDRADAARVARTIASLRRHAARHAAAGNGFGLRTINRDSRSIPTLLRSYFKINASGTFVETPYGERMLRPAEMCRIHGHEFVSRHARTIYQMSGQGCLTRLLRTAIAEPLARFLP